MYINKIGGEIKFTADKGLPCEGQLHKLIGYHYPIAQTILPR